MQILQMYLVSRQLVVFPLSTANATLPLEILATLHTLHCLLCCAVLCSQTHTRLPAAGSLALLQLALNCSDPVTATAAARRVPATAAAAARRMPDLLQPGVASKLLLTAASRQHTAAVCLMVHLAVMQQQIDAAALEAMLLQLLWQHDGAQELLPLPAADQLSTDAVVRLLRAVIQAPDAFAVLSLLRRLPATRQLSTGHVESLLQACMQEVAAHRSSSSSSRRGCVPPEYSPYRVFESLIQLPAARQLNSSAAAAHSDRHGWL